MLEELEKYAQENFVPIIRTESAKMLIENIKRKNPKQILEIGTAIGYSGLLILNNCEGFLTTIEKNPEREKIAEKNFQIYKKTERAKLICDDAQNVLEKLCLSNKHFDFVFLDGPKGQYIKYLPLIKNILNKGGILFADNIYLHGMVKSEKPIEHKHRTMVVNLRKFLKLLQEDKDFETKLYDVEDGIAIATLK